VSSPTGRLKIFHAITGAMGILAFGGFALMFLGGVFGDHLGMKSKARANVQRIPLQGCGYEDQNYCGMLIHMTRSNQAQHVRTLLAEGADPHERDGSGWSAWAYALSRGDSATIEVFLDAEVPARGKQDLPFNGTQRQNAPPLIFAIGQGNADAIQTLIKRGADPAERGPYGYPAANFAAYYGNVAALKALNESGLDLLSVTPPGLPHDGETFLMHAAEGGKPEAVDYLLALGADPGQRDPRGKTAADHAKAYGHAALAEILWTRAKQ
jgi:uncharacterized protein